MKSLRSPARIAVAVVAAAALGPFAGAASAQKAGTVASANISATSLQPGGGPKVATVGADVIMRERLQTTGEGTLQVALLDQSMFNIGRNSTVVIDEFVYDPARGAAKLSATMTKGVMRFVGGQVSHTEGATLQTPTAVIGVRGGVVTLAYDRGGQLLVVLHFGSADVQGQNRELLTRSGFGVLVDPAGHVGEPFLVPDDVLASWIRQLGSKATQHGGVPTIPGDDQGARFGIGAARLPDYSVSALDFFSIIAGGDALGRNKAVGTQAGPIPPGRGNTSGSPNGGGFVSGGSGGAGGTGGVPTFGGGCTASPASC